MARFDRCYVCDYTREEGSEFSGAGPKQNGRVLYFEDKPMCETCADEVYGALVELCYPEDPQDPEDPDTDEDQDVSMG